MWTEVNAARIMSQEQIEIIKKEMSQKADDKEGHDNELNINRQ